MKKYSGPAWVNSAVFYEIYPQTFKDSNGDGIGDLPGIIEKLDYLQWLGVTCIWLNPCFVSPFRDAGYDVADYCKIAPRYGTNADAKKLFREAGKRGIRVLLDFVPGHTSADHPWFKASCSPKPNKYSNWYIWTKSVWDNGGEKWAPNMVKGYADRDGNYLINFFCHQPALNFGFKNPEKDKPWQLSVDHPDVKALRAEMKKILRFWLDMGCSGFRVDMAGSLVRNDPKAEGIRAFWGDVRKMLDKDYPDAFIVAEWSHPKNAVQAGFHADFFHWFKGHYDLFRAERNRSGPGGFSKEGSVSFFDPSGKGDVADFLKGYFDHYAVTKGRGHIAIPGGNHDLPRINADRTPKDLELIMAFLLTIPGTPFIYYGDEIGMKQLWDVPNMEGAYAPRKGARTPMQWTAGRNKGFSKAAPGKLYLPVDAAADAPNVDEQAGDDASLLNKTRMLISLRKNEPALEADAEFEPLFAEAKKAPFVFLRSKGREAMVVAFNPSNKAVDATFKLPGKWVKSEVFQIAGDEVQWTPSAKGICLKMPACSYALVHLD